MNSEGRASARPRTCGSRSLRRYRGAGIFLITGEKTLNPLRMIIEELSRVMPAAERVTIPGATHDMWLEQPEACGKATLSFLARH